jgi:hypothetical protein
LGAEGRCCQAPVARGAAIAQHLDAFLLHQQGQAPLQGAAVERGAQLLLDGFNAHAVGGGDDEFDQPVQLLGGGDAWHAVGFVVVGALRQNNVAKYFIRHINAANAFCDGMPQFSVERWFARVASGWAARCSTT